MAYNFPGMPPLGIGPVSHLTTIPGTQSFIDLSSQGFSTLPPQITLPGMNDASLEFIANKNQSQIIRENSDGIERRNDKNDARRDREKDNRDIGRRSKNDRDRRERDRDWREERMDREHRDDKKSDDRELSSNSIHNGHNNQMSVTSNTPVSNSSGMNPSINPSTQGVWGMGIGYPVMGMGPMGSVGSLIGDMSLGPHISHPHPYGTIGMSLIPHEGNMMNSSILGSEQIMNEISSQMNTGPMSSSTVSQGTKEIIQCKSCTLFPPNPNAPPPTTRERPPGCRTVFVGGLPENITENIIQEIFERCGEITTLRLSKKNFCHIRFASESSVDAAIYLSSYRVRIGSNGDSSNTGRLHVDFAQARDDQYEWECRQRQLQREQRHRERVEKERQRQPSSPPPVIHYTDHEASNVCEKIKQDDSFMKAVQVVITWLERGDCTKRNANTFYSMIQSTNSHVRRLLTEKSTYEDELQKAKELLKSRMQGLLIQFSQIERVFTAASHKKVWDHFTKAQRKNIEMWKKQSLEIKTIQLEETAVEGEDEMEVSDTEDEPQRKRARINLAFHEDTEKFQNLKEENDSLRCQLEAYKNEVDILKSETKTDIEVKEKQIKMLQQTLKGMQEQLMQSKKQQVQDDLTIKVLTVKLSNTNKEESDDNEVIMLDKDDDEVINDQSYKPLEMPCIVQMTQNDAKLIGLIATFLHIHPFGASLEQIYYYLQKLEPNVKIKKVERLLKQFSQTFKQEVYGTGVTSEKRWVFSAFGISQSQNNVT
ncbi:hypothetical protein TKK_0003618 [Trichogramma kaykai]|uniref:RRM domain-containing protein n=1 Tax=Trichogramma kaykai TaxID=54128 RepID=A0ABD2XQ49_9HYME